MIDIAKILSSPERDDEIRKLISEHFPDELSHSFMQGVCVECGIRFVDMPSRSFCTKAPLDWNLAMKMRDDAVKPAKFAFFLEEVCDAENRMDYQFALWLVWEAQPIHYILAAILAGEG